MNAGGVLYTCKSSEAVGNPQSSGERVRNTWIIYLPVWDNWPKGLLIPDETPGASDPEGKGGLCKQAIAGR